MLLLPYLMIRLFALCLFVLSLLLAPSPAQAADHYVSEFLKAVEPVPVKLNDQGETQLVSPNDLITGKALFKTNCINCHVGGSTLPNPVVSLSLDKLKGATPPRDNIKNFMAYMRQPMTYDGQDYAYLCREVTEKWMPDAELEKLAAFVIRAADVAPGWGSENF